MCSHCYVLLLLLSCQTYGFFLLALKISYLIIFFFFNNIFVWFRKQLQCAHECARKNFEVSFEIFVTSIFWLIFFYVHTKNLTAKFWRTYRQAHARKSLYIHFILVQLFIYCPLETYYSLAPPRSLWVCWKKALWVLSSATILDFFTKIFLLITVLVSLALLDSFYILIIWNF